MKKNTGRILGQLLALAVLAALVYVVDYRELIRVFSALTLETVGYLLAISFLLVYISALKWSYFLASFGARVPVLRLFALYHVGYFVNLLLPSYVGGDLVRSWYVGKKLGQREALISTVLERYTGLVAMVLLGLITVWFVDSIPWQIEAAVILVALGVVIGSVLAVSSTALKVVAALPGGKLTVVRLGKVQDGLKLAASNKRLVFQAMALSFLFHTFTVVNTVAAAWAVGWDNPPWLDLFVVLPLILLIGAIPITPSGLGVQEGAFFFFLTKVGATPSQALGVALVLRAKSYVLALLGGIFWWFEHRRKDHGEVVSDC